MWSLDLTNKQIILNWYDSFIPILALLAYFWLFYLKTTYMWPGSFSKTKIWKDAIGIEFNTKKKVLCSAEKSSVIWAEPHSRSSAALFGRTERWVGHYLYHQMLIKYPNYFSKASSKISRLAQQIKENIFIEYDSIPTFWTQIEQTSHREMCRGLGLVTCQKYAIDFWKIEHEKLSWTNLIFCLYVVWT